MQTIPYKTKAKMCKTIILGERAIPQVSARRKFNTRISELRSESGGRINAVMENGEHVIISRRYAKLFRRELRGED